MAEVVEDGQGLLPAVAGGFGLAGGVVGVADPGQSPGLVVAGVYVTADAEGLLIAVDGLAVIPGSVVGVAEAVPDVGFLVAVAVLECHIKGLLTAGERELIATYVSALNDCLYCCSSHSAYAAAQLPGGMALVEEVCNDAASAPVSAKLRALLGIAAAVRQSGLRVSEDDVAAARAAGATDLEIHDTVLIAAAFCMFNRYVDGLATIAPVDSASYDVRAQKIVAGGYLALLAESQA